METTVVKKLKRSYTAAFKLKVVEHAKKKSKNDASKVFSVDRKIVQEWCKQSNGNWEKCKKTLMRKTPRKTIYADVEIVREPRTQAGLTVV